MKGKILKSVFVCSLALISILGVKGKEEDKKPIVMEQFAYAEEETVEYGEEREARAKVVASASTNVAPDSAIIYCRIENQDNDITLSKENNNQIFNLALENLKEKGLQEDSIKLECFSCQPRYDFNNYCAITGYHSTCAFSVEVGDLDNLDGYISAMTDAGVTAIDSVCYQVSNMEEQYNQMLTKAIENATQKAQKLLDCENVTLVKVTERSIRCCNDMVRGLSEASALAPQFGKVEIEAEVVAEYVCA